MLNILLGIFLALHGIVHLLYAGQSWRIFELRPGMTWPEESWALSKIAGIEGTRLLATILLVVGAIAFIVAGSGLIMKQDWWRSAILASTLFSSLIYLLFWDGAFQSLADKGAVGILINAGILLITFVWFRGF